MAANAWSYEIDGTAYYILLNGVRQWYQPIPAGSSGTTPFATAAAAESEASSIVNSLNA